MSATLPEQQLTQGFFHRINSRIWQGFQLETSVYASHMIHFDSLLAIRKIFFYYCVSVWIVGQCEHTYALIENCMFLTQWGLIINILYFFFASKKTVDKIEQVKYSKIAHVLFEIGFCAQPIISVIYWFVVYPVTAREKTPLFFYQTLSEHGGMFIILIVDKLFNNIKFYKFHFAYLFAFMIAYLSCNLIVTFTYQPVYKILCWTKPISFYLALGCALLSAFHFFIGSKIYETFKKHREEIIMKKQSIEESEQEQEKTSKRNA